MFQTFVIVYRNILFKLFVSINLIKMVIVPVVLASIVAGVASIGDIKKLGRVGVKIMVYYLATSALAVAIGLAFANVFQPGAGMGIVGDAAVQGKAAESPTMSQILLNIVPTNPAESLAKGDVLLIEELCREALEELAGAVG